MKNWFKRILGKKEEAKPMFKEVRNGNQVSLYDQKTVEYMESELPNPSQEAFFKLIKEAEKIIISKTETNTDKVVKIPMSINGETVEINGHPTEKVQLAEITETEEVEKLKGHVEIRDETKGHLMTVGNLSFEFIHKDRDSIEVEYLGFGCLRIEKIFKDDAELKRPLEFLNYLDSMGISEPLKNWQEDQERRKESERRLSEWKSVAPKTLITYLESTNPDAWGQFDESLLQQLNEEIPETKTLILRLFQLYGTGFNRWSGVPVYETIPGHILLGVNIDFLNNIFETEDLSKEQKEGMARLLSGWDFEQQRKSDIEKVKPELKDELLRHLEEMGNEDKTNQFKHRVLG